MSILESCVGARLEKAEVHLAKYSGDSSYTTIDVVLRFVSAKSAIVFACLGDGSIRPYEREPPDTLWLESSDSFERVKLERLEGGILKGLSIERDSITLVFDGGTMRIENKGDEFEVHFDGKEIDRHGQTALRWTSG